MGNPLTLKENLQWSEEAVKYARSKIKESSTQRGLSAADQKTILEKINLQRAGLFSYLESLSLLFMIPQNSLMRDTKESTRLIKKNPEHPVGNCFEYMSVAFHFLRKRNIPCETFCFKGSGDHTFLVLGRKPGSDEKDYKTWGENAVICDPWTNQFFSVADIEKNFPGVDKQELASNYGYGITNAIDEKYQEELIKEAIGKLTIIESVLNSYLSTEAIKKDIELLQKNPKTLIDKKMTNNDMEKMLNKMIKNALKLTQTLTDSKDKAHTELVTKVLVYLNESIEKSNKLQDYEKRHLLSSIHFGNYNKEITDIAKKLLKK